MKKNASRGKSNASMEKADNGLKAYVLSGLGISIVILLITGAAMTYTLFQELEQLSIRQSNIHAEAQAKRLESLLNRYIAQVDSWANDSMTRGAISSGAWDRMRDQEQYLARLAPGVMRVRVMDRAPLDTDLNDTPPLSFAGLALLRRAARLAQPQEAELHLPGDGQQHLAIARQVTDADGKPIGVVMGNFPLRDLQAAMEIRDQAIGFSALQQTREDGGRVDIVTAGLSDYRQQGAPAISQPIRGSRWHLNWWVAPPGEIAGGGLTGTLASIILLAIALIGATLFFLFRRLDEQMQNDHMVMIGLVSDVLQGKPRAHYPLQLPACQNAAAIIIDLPNEQEQDEQPQQAEEIDNSLIAHPHPHDDLNRKFPKNVPGLPREIFRAYDIRGVVGESLTGKIIYEIGRAIGSEAYDRTQQSLIIGCDARLSSENFLQDLARGIQASGRDVIDIGMVPTPVLYFATHYLGSRSGVMVTGSHNPPEYNGLKIVIDGEALFGDGIKAIYDRIASGNMMSGEGSYQKQEILPDYLSRIASDVHPVRRLKVVLDCGNGVAGVAAPELLRRLDCDVTELYCEVDGTFPNHHPNPSKPENLAALITAVRQNKADIGLALDGDGDRIGVVDSEGNIIWPDRLMMLFARDLLARHPQADIVYDIKCTRNLPKVIEKMGGRAHVCRTGHSPIKAKVEETGALLAGELTGHIVFKERWFGFDDGLYTCARLVEILANERRSSAKIFAEFPDAIGTPELEIPVEEGRQHTLMEQLQEKADFPDAEFITVDGLRAEFSDGWGLVRASNTTPSLTMRFEADNAQALQRIQGMFHQLLKSTAPDIAIPV